MNVLYKILLFTENEWNFFEYFSITKRLRVFLPLSSSKFVVATVFYSQKSPIKTCIYFYSIFPYLAIVFLFISLSATFLQHLNYSLRIRSENSTRNGSIVGLDGFPKIVPVSSNRREFRIIVVGFPDVDIPILWTAHYIFTYSNIKTNIEYNLSQEMEHFVKFSFKVQTN